MVCDVYFLFLRLYNFIKGIVRIFIFFPMRMRRVLYITLLLHFTYELVQILVTSNRTYVSLFKQWNNWKWKNNFPNFLYTSHKPQRMSEPSFPHLFIAIFLFSNTKNFFILSLNRFALKKAAYALLVFSNWVPFLFLVYANFPFKCLSTGLRKKPFWCLCKVFRSRLAVLDFLFFWKRFDEDCIWAHL